MLEYGISRYLEAVIKQVLSESLDGSTQEHLQEKGSPLPHNSLNL